MQSDYSIVAADMVKYEILARLLQEQLGPSAVKDLDNQIKDYFRSALSRLGLTMDHIPHNVRGDGALLLMSTPEAALDLAAYLHHVVYEDNRLHRLHSAQRHFRVGIATGPVVLQSDPADKDFSGTAIIDAVRLQTASGTGEIVIDERTYFQLLPPRRAGFGESQRILVKHGNQLEVRRLRVEAAAPWETPIVSPPTAHPHITERFRWRAAEPPTECLAYLKGRTESDLMHILLDSRFAPAELDAIFFSVFPPERLLHLLPNATKQQCALEVVFRAKVYDKLDQLCFEMCRFHPALGK